MGRYTRCSISFGLEVTAYNRSIDFKINNSGSELQATLPVGLYTASSLALAVGKAMRAVDPVNTYSVTVDRTVTPRIRISTSGAFLSLLFGSGTRAASSAGPILGYTGDQLGLTQYSATNSVGLIISPEYPPQEYQPSSSILDAKRSENETTSGLIEIVNFATFQNFEFMIRWIPERSSDYYRFAELNRWLLRGGPIEFTEDVTRPTVFDQGTPYKMSPPLTLKRMVPDMYDYFESPMYRFRVNT